MKNLSRLFILTALPAFLTFQSCKDDPGPVTFDGCNGSMVVHTSSYDDSGVTFFFPTAFTPNGDGLNDVIGLVSTGVTAVELSIQQGSGTVYQTSQVNAYWDGKHNGAVIEGNCSYEASLVTIHGDTVELSGSFVSLTQSDPNVISKCDGCSFPDQIDPQQGFVHPTAESTQSCK